MFNDTDCHRKVNQLCTSHNAIIRPEVINQIELPVSDFLFLPTELLVIPGHKKVVHLVFYHILIVNVGQSCSRERTSSIKVHVF